MMKEDMRTSWREAALCAYDVYGSYVCWKGETFDCPECGEPLYRDDWKDHDFSECPVCGFRFFEEAEE